MSLNLKPHNHCGDRLEWEKQVEYRNNRGYSRPANSCYITPIGIFLLMLSFLCDNYVMVVSSHTPYPHFFSNTIYFTFDGVMIMLLHHSHENAFYPQKF